MFQLLHSFCMLIQLRSKSFKLGFISIWTENFQLYKLHFTEAEEPETSCQYLSDHGESKGSPEKYLHETDKHDGVITHLQPDILECEVKWALGSIPMNKASGGDGIELSSFKS